jgi:hypothetical protein
MRLMLGWRRESVSGVAWIRKRSNHSDTSRSVRKRDFIEYRDPSGYVGNAQIGNDPALASLSRVTVLLAKEYGWTAADATRFVLTNEPIYPTTRPIVEARRGSSAYPNIAGRSIENLMQNAGWRISCRERAMGRG